MRHPRPRVVISRCLDFDACRYNGRMIRAGLRAQLGAHVELVPVCPELEIGLGVPRDPVRLVRGPRGVHMEQPSTGRDLTARMVSFSTCFLDGVGEADAFILKARSPSCGVRGVEVRAGRSGPGMFAARVRERYPHAAIEDEARLTDPRLRHHFLTKAFALAALRHAAARGTTSLAEFHSRNELLLIAHGEVHRRGLQRLLADAAPVAEYRAAFAAALAHPAPPEGTAQALALAASWAARGEDRRLAEQSFVHPYPAELAGSVAVTNRQRRTLRELPGAGP